MLNYEELRPVLVNIVKGLIDQAGGGADEEAENQPEAQITAADYEDVLNDEEKLNNLMAEIFSQFDNDGSGQMELAEFENFCIAFAQKLDLPMPSTEVLQEQMQLLDSDSDKGLSIEELKPLIRGLLEMLSEQTE